MFQREWLTSLSSYFNVTNWWEKRGLVCNTAWQEMFANVDVFGYNCSLYELWGMIRNRRWSVNIVTHLIREIMSMITVKFVFRFSRSNFEICLSGNMGLTCIETVPTVFAIQVTAFCRFAQTDHVFNTPAFSLRLLLMSFSCLSIFRRKINTYVPRVMNWYWEQSYFRDAKLTLVFTMLAFVMFYGVHWIAPSVISFIRCALKYVCFVKL